LDGAFGFVSEPQAVRGPIWEMGSDGDEEYRLTYITTSWRMSAACFVIPLDTVTSPGAGRSQSTSRSCQPVLRELGFCAETVLSLERTSTECGCLLN